MSRAARVTLLALAALVIAFVATWLTVPSSPGATVKPPASFFISGITTRRSLGCIDFGGSVWPDLVCVRRAYGSDVDVEKLEQRVRFGFGGAAVVIVLVGLAFGAARRSRSTP